MAEGSSPTGAGQAVQKIIPIRRFVKNFQNRDHLRGGEGIAPREAAAVEPWFDSRQIVFVIPLAFEFPRRRGIAFSEYAMGRLPPDLLGEEIVAVPKHDVKQLTQFG